MNWRGSVPSLLGLAFTCLIVFSSSALGYYYPDTHVPPGPPPNYNQVDTTLFKGTPSIPVPPPDSGGYFIYWDSNEWNIVSHIFSVGNSLEQFHGSILATMEAAPELGVNVFIEDFELWGDTTRPLCLDENDRWGWVEWEPGLYEIWWDVTTKERKDTGVDISDFIRLRLVGCAVDFNLWSSAHGEPFDETMVFLGENMVRLSDVDGFVDTYAGITDPYQAQAGNDPESDPNITIFEPKELPGASYNMYGLIDGSETFPCPDIYGSRYTGSFAYEGNGIQFSTDCLVMLNEPPDVLLPNDSLLLYCQATEFCFEIVGSDPNPGDVLTLTLLEGPVSYAGATGPSPLYDTICFAAETEGEYRFIVQVEDQDGLTDVDTVTYTVAFNQPGQLSCPADTAIELCRPLKNQQDTICVAGFTSSWDSTWSSIGTLHSRIRSVCFTPDTVGTYTITMYGTDDCGAIDSCSTQVTVSVNGPPMIVLGDDFSVTSCDSDTACFDVSVHDFDGDDLVITTNFGTYTGALGQICFPTDTNGIYTIIASVEDPCGHVATDTINVTVDRATPVAVVLGEDYQTTLCQPSEICIDASVTGDVAQLTTSYGLYNADSGKICFIADTAGVYEIILSVLDDCGLEAADTAYVTVGFESTGLVDLGADIQVVLCDIETVCIPGWARGEIVDITTSIGTYQESWPDPRNSQVCFTPDTSGVYEIILSATTTCGGVLADTAYADVTINHAPQIAPLADTTVYLCFPQEICLDAEVFDLDGNFASVTVNHGTYSDSKICFVPYNGSTYEIILTVTDDCGLTAVDTAIVTVITDQGITLECPEDTTIFLCEPDTVCFPIGGVPAGAEVTVGGLATWWDEDSQSICFFSDCCIENTLTVTVTTECGTYSCSFDVSVQTNSEPLVILPPDTTVLVCQDETICLPVGITDIDGNIADITVTGGVYDDYENTICFATDGAGSYTIGVTVTDTCGALRYDEVVVTVEFNQPPFVTPALLDTTVNQCEFEEVCVEFEYGDPDGNFASLSIDPPVEIMYDTGSGRMTGFCFVPASFGQHCFTITATDSCGAVVTAVVCVTVEGSTPVSIQCPDYTGKVLCAPGTACFEIPITGDFTDVITSAGVWENGQLCIHSDELPIYRVTIIAVGDCNSDTCEVIIDFDAVTPPEVTCPTDTSLFLCDADTVVLPYAIAGGIGPFQSITATAPAWVEYDVTAQGWFVHVPIDASSSQTITLTHASAPCEPAECSFTVTAELNTPPTITANDSLLTLCELQEICVPFVAEDIDGNLADVTSSLGVVVMGPSGVAQFEYNDFSLAQGTDSPRGGNNELFVMPSGEVCFTPEEFGDYQIILTAADSCGAQDTVEINVAVNQGDTVLISCPTPITPLTYCDPGTYSFDVPVAGSDYSVSTSNGSWADGQLTFTLDTNGYYAFEIIADADCNSDTCLIEIYLIEPVTVACGITDTSFVFCEETSTQLVVPVDIFGDSALVLSLTPSTVELVDGNLIVPIGGVGSFEVSIVVQNECSKDSCSFTVSVDLNREPVALLGPDTTLTQCEFEEICISYGADDVDGNLASISSSLGVINGEMLCFTPSTYGEFTIILTAVDDCGASAVDTVLVTVNDGVHAVIECPTEPFFMNVEIPETVRVPLTIEPSNAVVTVSPSGSYDATTGELVVEITTLGMNDFEVIAAADCDADTCVVSIEAGEFQPPLVECVGVVDTALCLLTPSTLCLPLTITGTDITVDVNPIGEYDADNSQICLTITEPGEFTIEIIASNSRYTDTCYSVVTVTGGNPPIALLPADSSVFLCSPAEVCVQAVIQDTDFDLVSYEVIGGTYDTTTGLICFYADTSGVYELTISALDECDNFVADTMLVTVTTGDAPTISLGDDIDELACNLSEICVDVTYSGSESAVVTTNFGTFDPGSNQICFTPEGSGTFEIIAAIQDDCGAAVEDTIVIMVEENVGPSVSGLNDTALYLCFPQEICWPLDIADANDNVMSVYAVGGTYVDGQVCFTPYNGGAYQVIVIVTDSCGIVAADTANIEITTDQGISLTGPGDTTVFLCEPDTLCFPIGGIPEGANVTVGGLATYWDAEAQAICFFSECCLENKLTVTVTTECGTFTHEFFVSVQTNSAPLLLLPPDTSITQCAFEEICLPIGITDIDGNLMSVVADGAVYDSYRNEVCFTPDTAGTYIISVTATDTCGAISTDEISVVVALNSAPVVSYQDPDTSISQCVPEEVCLPIDISDLDGNLAVVTVDGGYYDEASGTVCFMPDGVGTFCLTVTATDSCGLIDQFEVCQTIVLGDYVTIECVEPEPFTDLCQADSVCFALPITGDNFTVSTNIGSWVDGSFCFWADTTGIYSIEVIAEAECNVDTCTLSVPIVVLEPLAISCPEDDSQFLCGPDTLCYDFTFAPASATVSVSAPAYLSNGQVCVPVLQEGTQTITMTVSNHCGEETCSFDVTTDFNAAPIVTMPTTIDMVECSFFEVCIPLDISDEDGNIVDITVSQGELRDDSLVCFTPDAFGSYELIVTATDACGLTSTDTTTLSFTEGNYAAIECPDGAQFASLCGPDTVCILAAVTPAEAIVTVLPAGTYNPATGEVCVYVTEGGTHEITIIAEAQCGADTCTFNLEVDFGIEPQLTCPEAIDTTLCLAQPDTLCIPVDAIGTGVQVNVNPIGYYSAGFVCLPITEAGDFTIEVIAYGTCGADTCEFSVSVTADQAPELILPETLTFERCPDDTELVCIDGIFATDFESPVTIRQVCGPGDFAAVVPDSGGLCFLPDGFGLVEFCFEADDGCQTVTRSFFVDIALKPDCDVCVRVSIDGGKCIPVGLRHRVSINIETNDAIGGFDLLLSYDASALSFQFASMEDGAASDWEYFTWNLNNAGCGTACPSGIVRLVGIADMNNGASHPPLTAYEPNGVLVWVEFQVANDQNLGDVFIPISFVWFDCSDNSFSDPTGELLYIDSRVYNAEGILIWDEFDDVTFPESSRIPAVGAADSCIGTTEKAQPLRCAEFFNGGICIIHPDSIDARGDINLNGVLNEIADAVVFTNYFIRGLAAFTINVHGQVAATDINGDGLTLTVSDLSLLIRIIIGDADPIPKVTPYTQRAVVSTDLRDGLLSIETETAGNLGAAYFVYDIDPGLSFSEPQKTEASADFDIIWAVDGEQLKILMFDIGDAVIAAGRQSLLTVPVIGEGKWTLAHSELVDYQGRPYALASAAATLPSGYSLSQNYPNPFNPSTRIQFGLPTSSAWQLQIYNIRGELVRNFSGHSDGGFEEIEWDGRSEADDLVASGVYFYRLDAAAYTETRKMILLK